MWLSAFSLGLGLGAAFRLVDPKCQMKKSFHFLGAPTPILPFSFLQVFILFLLNLLLPFLFLPSFIFFFLPGHKHWVNYAKCRDDRLGGSWGATENICLIDRLSIHPPVFRLPSYFDLEYLPTLKREAFWDSARYIGLFHSVSSADTFPIFQKFVKPIFLTVKGLFFYYHFNGMSRGREINTYL